jgi:vacuolar-type H+-ATPase subunit E/Vma4
MALADIIRRIDGDAEAEAADITKDARARAEELIADANRRGERDASGILDRGSQDAESEAATIRAAARLQARDRLVAAKGALVEQALDATAAALTQLPDKQYVVLMARRIAAVSRGGERLRIAAADVARLKRALPAAIKKAAGHDLELRIEDEPADVEHGVVVEGERSVVDLSIAALIEERRSALAMLAAEILFGDDEKSGE